MAMAQPPPEAESGQVWRRKPLVTVLSFGLLPKRVRLRNVVESAVDYRPTGWEAIGESGRVVHILPIGRDGNPRWYRYEGDPDV